MSKPPPDWCKNLRDCEVRCDNCPENEMSKQEPTAFYHKRSRKALIFPEDNAKLYDLKHLYEELPELEPLYLHPQEKRKWKHLTEEEIRTAIISNSLDQVKESALQGFYEYISHRLKEKNS